MSWTTAIDDLRALLSDGPFDKLRHRKKVFGEVNGANVSFKTFEFRRVTNFTTAVWPLGVFKNGVILLPAAVSQDVVGSGDFQLVTAPVDGDYIEASYYVQWFLDSELGVFLKGGSQFLSMDGTYSDVPSGLQPAALHYAASEAYLKLALRWKEYLADTYRLDDNPKREQTPTDDYIRLAEEHKKRAQELRKSYYGRNDQAEAPLFGAVIGQVRNLP